MLKLKEFQPRIIDKKVFIDYYDNKDLEEIIRDIGNVSVAFTELGVVKEFVKNCEQYQKPAGEAFLIEIWDKAGLLLKNLPFGEKTSAYIKNLREDLRSGRFRNEENIRKFFDGYQTALNDLMQGYRKILKKRASEL